MDREPDLGCALPPASGEAGVGLVEGESDEAGFTLVEALVSFVVLMLLGAAGASGLVMALRTSGNNEARVVATNLAARQIEKARGADVRLIPDGPLTRTEVVDGRSYTVTQTTGYDTVGGTGNSCEGTSGPAAFKWVHVEVAWPGMHGVAPVRSDTVRTLPVQGLDDGSGILTLGVRDGRGAPVSGLTVELTAGTSSIAAGTTPIASGTTGADGCVVFANLVPGTGYVASVQRAGWTDVQGQERAVRGPLSVLAGRVTKDPGFVYDRHASLRLTPGTLAGYQAPDGVGVTVGSALFVGKRKAYPRCATGVACAVGAAQGDVRISPLFPASDGYTSWLGTCDDAKPADLPVPPRMEPGTESTGTTARPAGIRIARGGLDRGDDDDDDDRDAGDGAGVSAWAVHAADSSCPAGEAFRLGAYGSNIITAALPVGTWRLVLTRGAEDPRAVTGGMEVRLVAGHVITLDGDDD